uniref:RRM domain-containing protein n=1 Tax=Leersia perrieri TaxID=77586 RepID=A0A0D9V8A0_9ORYZ
MRIPESARLFVGGVSPDTVDVELHYYFSRYGYVADIWLRRDAVTGLPRRYAFVQFMLPADAARALADKNHIINGQKVYVGIAEPTKSSTRLINQMSKFLCQRIYRIDNSNFRIGDRIICTLGPLYGKYEESDYINNLRRFGVMKGNVLTFDCVIDYISQDGQYAYISIVLNRSDAKPIHGNISSTRFVGRTSAKFCRYCQQAVTPGGTNSNYDGMVHTDACLIYQESFVPHYPYGVIIANSWVPIGSFIIDV